MKSSEKVPVIRDTLTVGTSLFLYNDTNVMFNPLSRVTQFTKSVQTDTSVTTSFLELSMVHWVVYLELIKGVYSHLYTFE